MNLENTVLIIDGMCIVNEVISVACPKSCKDLADVFVNALKGRSRGYESYLQYLLTMIDLLL